MEEDARPAERPRRGRGAAAAAAVVKEEPDDMAGGLAGPQKGVKVKPEPQVEGEVGAAAARRRQASKRRHGGL